MKSASHHWLATVMAVYTRLPSINAYNRFFRCNYIMMIHSINVVFLEIITGSHIFAASHSCGSCRIHPVGSSARAGDFKTFSAPSEVGRTPRSVRRSGCMEWSHSAWQCLANMVDIDVFVDDDRSFLFIIVITIEF